MLEAVFDSLRKATGSTVQVQQEMFKKWMGMWPALTPTQPTGTEQVLRFKQKWAEVAGELARKQRESLEAQFSAGLRNIEEAFHMADAKDPEDLRARAIELWQKSFECLRQLSEAQARDFQSAVVEWAGLVGKGAA